MDTVTRINSVRQKIADWRRADERIAFVQTMGALHKGHLALIAEARAKADRIVASVFVNPLQFGPDDDMARYPRGLERDKSTLEEAGVDLMFAPTAFEMYPTGFERTTVVDAADLSGILEGQVLPSFCVGFATVTVKLLQIVQPDIAVYGEKDFQQLVIVRRLVADLCMPLEIAAVPVVRDHDGLAFGARNRLLTPRDRNVASRLHDALRHAQRRIREGERGFASVQELGLRELERGGFAPDYFSVRQSTDLMPPRAESRDLVILAAGRLGLARLVDCIRLQLQAPPQFAAGAR
jgi:pantoate--beta-alanine ligase